MRNKFKKGVSLALAGIMILGSFSPVFANVEETQTTSTNETLATDVYFNQDSSFTVTIPKLIKLDSTKTSTYTVTVEGDIASNEQVNVVPEKEFLMKDQALTGIKKSDVTATVSQDKEGWKFNEFTTLGNGTVTAEGLTSGSWKGSFWFNISLDGVTTNNDNSNENTEQVNYFYLNKNNYQQAGIEDLEGEIVIPATVTVDGEEMPVYVDQFSDCTELTSVVIEEGVKEISEFAFDGCTNLLNVVVPTTVTTVTGNPFEYTPWFTAQREASENGLVIIGNGILIDGTMATGEVIIPNNVTYIASYSFENNTNITSVIIPENVHTIENMAFYQCANLVEIIIPSSVTNFGIYMFDGTPWLVAQKNTSENGLVIVNGILINAGRATGNVILPNNVHTINGCAFAGNQSISNITLPESLKTIDIMAFNSCEWLTSIEIPASVTKVGSSAFNNCINLEQITVSENNTIYDSRDNCNAIIETSTNRIIVGCKNTVIPNTIETIGTSAFSGCTKLTNIDIPNSVTSIGPQAFIKCTGLTSITIPNSVTSIGLRAFMQCTGLTSITIPNSVKTIDFWAFAYTGLTNVTYQETTYTNVSELTTALKDNGVKLTSDTFENTPISK